MADAKLAKEAIDVASRRWARMDVMLERMEEEDDGR